MEVMRAPARSLALLALALVACGGGAEDAPVAKAPAHRSSNGTLSPDAIKSVVRSRSAAMQECYLAGVLRDKNLSGAVTVSFRIDEQGRVEDAKLAAGGAAEIRDADVRECVRRVFEGLRFPPPKGGTVGVTYPVRFGRE
jgi:TonB family protein